LDGRSDVYALGVVLFEIATGHLPFAIKTLSEAVFRHVYTPVPSPRSRRPDLPEALDNLILRCLAKTAVDRPSASELAAVLRGLIGTTTGAAASVVVSSSMLGLQTGGSTTLQIVPGGPAPEARTQIGRGSTLPQIQVLNADGGLLQVIAVPLGGLSIGRMPS